MQYSQYLRPVLALAFFVSMVVVLAKGFTADTTFVLAQPQDEERTLENLIPKNVPISIKIKKEKEKAFKDLNNEKWAHDLELEVTNTGDKPFYYVSIRLTLNVEGSNGKDFNATVYWGRTELGDARAHATPDDESIKPGESVVLRFHPAYLNALDKMRREEGKPLPTTIKAELVFLTFGNGTGYILNTGELLPRKISKTRPLGNRRDPTVADLSTQGLQPATVPANFCLDALSAN